MSTPSNVPTLESNRECEPEQNAATTKVLPPSNRAQCPTYTSALFSSDSIPSKDSLETGKEPGVVAFGTNRQKCSIAKKKSGYKYVLSRKRKTACIFQARPIYIGKKYHVGFYHLEADAALAADELVRLFKGSDSDVNFETMECYKQARALELEATGATVKTVDSCERIRRKILQRIREIASEYSSAGKAVTVHFDSLLTNETSAGASSSAATPAVAKFQSNRNLAQNRASVTELRNMKTQSSPLKSKVLPTNTKSDLISIDSSQTNSLAFPMGCVVMANFKPDGRGEFYQKGNIGTISGAFFNVLSRDILYEVMTVNDESSLPLIFNEKELVYAPGCPVKYSPSGSVDSENCIRAKVLLCQTKPKLLKVVDTPQICYTVGIFHHGQPYNFEVIEDVTSDQIKYNHD